MDAESIDENLITIENKVTGDSFPVSILPPHRDDEIRIRPVEFLAYETEYELIIAPGIPDLSGNPSIETFRKSITTDRDYNGPKLLSIRSSDAAEMIVINTSFDLVFSEAISPNVEGIVYLHLVFDDNTFSSVPGIPVPTTNTVLDNVLTIVPTEPLKHGEEYIIDINNGRNRRGYVEDLHGNERVSIAPTGIYKTVPYPNKVDIDFSIEHVEVNLQNNKAYALDQKNQKLVVLDLATDTIEGAYSLDHTPSRLCLDDEYDRIFITYTDSPTVPEYTLATPEKLGDISWSPDKSVGNTPDEPQHNGILCGTDKLYLSDMAHNPQLFEIDRHAPHSVKRIEAIEGVGEFQLTSDGDMYVVSQYGGRASIKAERYQNHNGTWNLVDDTNFLNYYEYRKDPIDAPIFVDEQNGFLISKRYIFNRLDLNDIVHDFGEGRLISAVDFVNGHIVVDDGIYTYPGLQKVEYIPVSTMGGAFFNLSGDLHLVDEKTSELLPISHTDL